MKEHQSELNMAGPLAEFLASSHLQLLSSSTTKIWWRDEKEGRLATSRNGWLMHDEWVHARN
jgi:hypothetical protein